MSVARTYRLLVWSGDRVSGTTTDYVIEISPAFNDIVYVDRHARSLMLQTSRGSAFDCYGIA